MGLHEQFVLVVGRRDEGQRGERGEGPLEFLGRGGLEPQGDVMGVGVVGEKLDGRDAQVCVAHDHGDGLLRDLAEGALQEFGGQSLLDDRAIGEPVEEFSGRSECSNEGAGLVLCAAASVDDVNAELLQVVENGLTHDIRSSLRAGSHGRD